MRLVIILNLLFLVVNPCVDFWKEWKDSSLASSAERRFTSKKHSTAVIYANTLTITCGNEALDYDLIPCLNDTRIQIIIFKECYMSNFDVGRFVSNNDIVRMEIIYNTKDDKVNPTQNFESAHFENMPGLKYLKLVGLRTSETLNLSFDNVPSLTYLKIENFNTTSLLPRPFQQLTNLSELYIDEGSLKFSSEDDFYGLHNLQKLIINCTLIERIPPGLFRNLIRLEILRFFNNKLQNLPSDMLRGLLNLKEFSIITNNRLTKLPPEFWMKIPKLTRFRITLCSLSQIKENIFYNVKNLSVVNLDENKIFSLPSKLFQNNKNLETFTCSVNKLSSLPIDIFNGLLKMKALDLSFNRLVSLSENLFQNLPSLKRLILRNNRIAFLPENVFFSLNNLSILHLSYNNLSGVSSGEFFRIGKNLKYLFMEYSGLTEWPKINWTAFRLVYAGFPGNRFDTVKLPIYTPNRSKINLINCKIKTIYIDDRKYGLNIPTYNLGFNQLTCDPELQQFVFAIKSNLEVSLKMFPDLNNMKCSGEERNVIDSRPFSAITNHCPVNCECYRDEEDVKLNSAGNGISEVPEVLIENATIVDLSNNNISKVSGMDWVTWKKVTHLYLSNNSLIDFSVYPLPPSLIYLSLDGNKLTALPQELFNLIDHSSNFRIFLSNNHWNCECDAKFTKDWLLGNKKKIADFDRVVCQINSTFFSFAEILSSDRCGRISINNLTLQNVVPREDSSNDLSFYKWKILIIILSLALLVSVIVNIFLTHLYRKNMAAEKSKSVTDKVIYSNIYDDIH